MPLDPSIPRRHILRTTFTACRAVKAAQMSQPRRAERFLRRLREAYYLEGRAIDEIDRVLEVAAEVGLDVDRLRDHLASGRAETFFQQDRAAASENGFGFPTIVIFPESGAEEQAPVTLQGMTPYADLCSALFRCGFPYRRRRRFQDSPADWSRLFAIRDRPTLTELLLVTRLPAEALERRLAAIGAARCGVLVKLRSCAGNAPQTLPHPSAEPTT